MLGRAAPSTGRGRLAVATAGRRVPCRSPGGGLALTQQPLELILIRQLATLLATPAFLIDPSRHLVFYNEAAGVLLGNRFEETGELPIEGWTALFDGDRTGDRAAGDGQLPLADALERGRPTHSRCRLRSPDGRTREVTVAAFPLVGLGGRDLGAVALVWEVDGP